MVPSRRRWWAMSLVLALTMLLTACGSGSGSKTEAQKSPETPAATPAPAPAEKVTLNLWSHWAGEQAKRDFVEGVAKAYNAKNPNVEIKVTWYDKNPLNTALRSAYQSGEAPDIHYVDPMPYHAVPYSEGGYLANLKGLIDESKWDPTFMQYWKYKDGIWGVPLETGGIFTFYNKKLFKDWGIEVKNGQLTPEQWDTVLKKCKETGITPISMGVQDRSGNSGWYWAGTVLTQMVGLEKANALMEKKINWNDPEIVEGLKTAKGQIDQGIFPANALSSKLSDSYGPFFQGKAATMVVGSWIASWMRLPEDKGGPPKGFEAGVMMAPALPGAKYPAALQVGTYGSYAVNAKSKNLKTAVDFLNFLASPENGQKWVELTGVPTGIKGAFTDKTEQFVKDQMALIDQAKVKIIPDWAGRMAGNEYEAWKKANDQLLTKEYSVDQFVKDLMAGRAKD
ncbi:MAG TPA: extracellular solute-binding protein [Symbiobacteriaceae bacterium]|nr:extracellular solute-binding protein [Symbiobacteriaceae bacterium]